ncbi:MAG: serine/threonine protein kinase, partial [Nitrospirae bacterium]|nr:serine/threonine protein kinase [Nitrospirota bacterium]
MNNSEWSAGDVILDLYEVREVFKSGGMGLVYRIYHKGWSSDMAMKCPRPEYFRTESQKSSFEREAQTWMDLGLHPNIVSCYYVRRIGGVPCVFAEYLEGGSLRDWIKQKKLLSMDVVLDAAIQFASGLYYAHEKGLIHQDVKPANVMMTSDGIAKVTDFGLARAQSLTVSTHPSDDPGADMLPQRLQRKSHVSSFGGMTQAYCSFEQANRGPLTLKTDIWSWSVSILEIFIGGVTWLSGNVAALVLNDYLRDPQPNANIPHMPQPLAALLKRCFAQDPDGRPDDMQEITIELKQIYRDIAGKDYPRGEYLAGRLTADSLNNRAVSFLDLGRTSEVVGVWKESLRVDPHHFESTFNLALYEWRRCAIAERDIFRRFDEIVRNQTLNHRDYNLIGRMYLFFGEYGKALETMWRGFNEATASQDELKALVAALSAEGRRSSKKDDTSAMAIWKDVEKYSKKLLEGGSRDIQIIAAHAMSLRRQGRTSESEAFYDKSRRDMPSLPDSVLAVSTGYLPGYEVINTFEGHNGLVSTVIVSADGKMIVTGGTEDRSVRIWDMDTGECLHVMEGHSDWVTCLCFSADEATVISGSLDRTLRFWDIKRGRCTRVLEGHRDGVTAITATADGRYILSGGNDAAIRLWSFKEGSHIRTLDGHGGRVTSLCMGPRGLYAISASNDKTIRLWNIVTGKCLMSMTGHEGAINTLAKLGNSSHILSASEDKTVRLWDTGTGQLIKTFTGHAGAVTSAAFMPDGRSFISGSTDNTLCRWDVESGQRSYVLKKFEGPSLALCPDGKTAVFSIWNGVRVINILNRYVLPYALAVPVSSEEAEQREGGFQTILDEAERLINEGSLDTIPELIKTGRQIKGYERDKEALKHLERLSQVFPRKRIQGAWELATAEGHEGAVNAVAISADGMYVVTGSADWGVRLWDASAMSCVKIFKGHEGAVNSVAISADNRFILSGGEDAVIRLWDIQMGACDGVFKYHSAPVTAVAFSRDGKYAISASMDGSVRLTDIKSRLNLRIFYERQSAATCAVATPELRSVIVGYEDGSLRLWDVDREECVATIKPYNNSVASVAISPDQKYVLSTGTFDNTFHIWDIGTKKLYRSFKGHTGGVLSAVFSPDGKFIISGSLDGTLRLWDVDSARISRTFTGNTGGVHCVCFGSDAWHAYSGSADHSLRSYYVDWELEARGFMDWDNGASPYVELFIAGHTPYIKNSFTRRGNPAWEEKNVESLISELRLRGFGWLRPDGVYAKLKELQIEAINGWQHAGKSYNEAITEAKELIKTGNYTAALTQINKARSVNSYKKEAEALRLNEEMSMVFPRTRLAAAMRLHVLRGHGHGITATAFTSGERVAVTTCKDNVVRVWDLSTGNCQMSLSVDNPVTSLLCCSGDTHVLSGNTGGSLRLWDVKTGEVLRIFKGHAAEISSLAFARGGRFLLSASKDGMMILWDFDTGERVKVYRCPSNNITCAAIDEDLAFIATGSTDRNIRLWDCAAGSVTKTLSGHTDTVMAIDISHDGTFIVSGGVARRIRAWDVASGKNTATFEGHSGAVTSLRISPDGRFFISGSRDGTALLWDKTQPAASAAFGGHTAPVNSVYICPSAHMMITGSEDRTAFVWYLQWGFTIRDFTDWVDGALPYLKRFLSRHRKIVNDTLITIGIPSPKDEDMAGLLAELRRRGFGWLTPEGVNAKLIELQAEIESDWKAHEMQYKEHLKYGRDFIKEKNYTKAIESLSQAHALKGFQREEEPLRLLDKMSGIFPKAKLQDVWRVNYLEGH